MFTGHWMFKFIILCTLIAGVVPIHAVSASEDMTFDMICPCECAMVLSACDCPTAIQVKNEMVTMKDGGFSEDQIHLALQAKYGREIMAHPEKINSMSLWMGGISLAVLSVFLGYIVSRKPNPGIIPDRKMYEQRFEEEYQEFVSEMEGT